MQTLLKALTRLFLRVFFKPVHGPPFSLAFQRSWIGTLSRAATGPKGVEMSELQVGELRVVLAQSVPDGAPPPGPPAPAERDAILLVHGGAFVLGSPSSYSGLAGWIAQATGADVYVPDYALAPEQPYPEPTDDLFAAYRMILERGHEPGRTAVIGDSAGGALAVSTVRTLPEMNVPTPAAMALLSPWLDLTLSAASVSENASRDPMLRRAWLEGAARAHAGELRLSDPRVSPLFADLATLPPTLIQVGSDEILLDDSVRFADRAWSEGVEVELQRFNGWWHDFQVHAGTLKPARAAIEDIAAFLARRFRDVD